MSDVAARPAFSGFTEKAKRPTLAAFDRVLGRARSAWTGLIGFLGEQRVAGKLEWMYGARFGWALRFRKAGRFVTALYPNRGKLFAQVVLGPAQVAAARRMHLPPRVAKVFAAAKDYPEGRWLFVPVQSVKDALDLRPLLALKLARPAKAKAR